MEIRPATLDDIDRLAAFMGRCTLAHQGVRRASADEVRQRLTRPGTDPTLDTWLVEDDGEVAGFAQVWRDEPAVVCYVRVDPEHTGRGIGSALLDRGAERALELGQAEDVQATSWPNDQSAAPLLESAGFVPIRYFSLMTTDIDQKPEAPTWPADIRIRALDDEVDLRPVHKAQQAAFPERPADFDSWLHEYTGDDFDRSLWFVAEDDSGIAGFALCSAGLPEDAEAGYVAELGRAPRPARRGARARAPPLHVRRVPPAGAEASVAARRRRQPDRRAPALHAGRHAPRPADRRLGAATSQARDSGIDSRI